MRFTKELRQQIIRDFCLRRNAEFDARLFEQEVRETGPSHPAYEWFEWDGETAAREHRIWQARQFSQGLKVSFSVEEVGRGGKTSVRVVEAPMLVSPVSGRREGGGYFMTDPNNPEHLAELARQAAGDLTRWLKRYESVLSSVGGSAGAIQKQIDALNQNAPSVSKEAA